MLNVPVITKRELSAHFLSPVAYVVITAFALVHGIFFASAVAHVIEPTRAAEWAFSWPILFMMFPAVPILTMRLLSEETNSGTIEALMTAPVSETEVVLGKYCGALIFMSVMLLPVLAEMVFLRALGPLDWGVVWSGFLGAFLLCSAFVSIGLFCSSLTRAQIASAIVTFAVLVSLSVVAWLGAGSQTGIARAARYVSPPARYTSFALGVVDTRDVTYFVVMTAAFLFLTVKALELRRWK